MQSYSVIKVDFHFLVSLVGIWKCRPSQPTYRPLKVPGEKYKRLELLGRGSFGKAFLCKNTHNDNFCVVKQMETSMMTKKEREDAVREARLLKKMDHPNIIKFQEVQKDWLLESVDNYNLHAHPVRIGNRRVCTLDDNC